MPEPKKYQVKVVATKTVTYKQDLELTHQELARFNHQRYEEGDAAVAEYYVDSEYASSEDSFEDQNVKITVSEQS